MIYFLHNRLSKIIISCIILCCLCLLGIRFLLKDYFTPYSSEEYFHEITGIPITADIIFSVKRDSGYSSLTACSISKFDKHTSDVISSNSAVLFSRPVLRYWEKEKTLQKWTKTPVDYEFSDLLTNMLLLMNAIGLPEEYSEDILSLARSEEGFYALTYEKGKNSCCFNVTFYLIEPDKGLFYYLSDTNRGFPLQKSNKPLWGNKWRVWFTSFWL